MPYVTDPGGLDGPGWKDLPGSVRERVVAILSRMEGIPTARITPDLCFVRDFDSLDTVELVMEFEEEFGITIPDADAERIHTVEHAAQYIATLVGKEP